jgi:hypothetical protein
MIGHSSFRRQTGEFRGRNPPGKDGFISPGPLLQEENIVRTLKDAFLSKKNGLTISCDMNYRSKLWTVEEARRIMPELMEFVDVAIIGVEDVIQIFGIPFEAVRSNLIRTRVHWRRPWEPFQPLQVLPCGDDFEKEASASVNQILGLLMTVEKWSESSLRHYGC